MATFGSAPVALLLMLAGASAAGITFGAPATAQATTVASVVTVTMAGGGSGTVTSSVGIINCPGLCDDTYNDGTLLLLTATPDASSQFTGWLGPCTGADACEFTVNGATTAVATFAPMATGAPGLDIDDSTTYEALTDGLLILRYLFGLSGAALTNGAVAPGAMRSTDSQIAGYLADIKPVLDIDGDGRADALTDGLLILRYLFGLRGPGLIAGAVGTGAIRADAADIATQIELQTGACRDGTVARVPEAPVAGDLVITEVMPSPAAVPDTAGEWFEVLVTRDVDLNGLGLDRASDGAEPTLILSQDCLRVTAGSLLVFARSADANANGGLTQVTRTFGFSLPGGSVGVPGDVRLLFGATVLDSFSWTHLTSGAALQLDPDFMTPAGNDAEANWCDATAAYGIGDLGTPGAANAQCVPVVPPGSCDAGGMQRAVVKPVAGQLVITEFLANPEGTLDDQREWFEIMNTSGSAFDLNGLELARTGLTGDIIASASCKSVPAGGFALFARSADNSLNGGLPVVDATFGFVLLNSNGAIEVRDGTTILDAITWTTGIEPGQSRQLDPDFLSVTGNDNPANFCNAATLYGDGTNTGTPKAANEQCP